MNPISCRAVLTCLALACSPMGAQPPEKPVLAGPTVPERVARTLVQHNAQGEFIRVEGRLETAALTVLGANQHQREAISGATADREGAINMLLADQVELVERSVDAFRAGEPDKELALLRELRAKIDPEDPRDPLLKPLSQVLAPEQHAELSRVLDEYWKAWVDVELLGAPDRSPEARARTQDRLVLMLFQEEVRQAYDRTLRPYRDRLERIDSIAEPTPEQRGQIRAAMFDFIRHTRLKPLMRERRLATQRIYAALDETRRLRLLDAYIFDE
jgi:hypothetical protein